jgi:DNA repair photolyase
LYRGCQHQCIYCDSRSQCYEIENFNHDVLVKVNAIELLEKELPSKRVKGVVGTGSMNDPYMPLEKTYNLTGRALALIAKQGFGVHINTKSDLVLRDLNLLKEINRVYAAVSFSITTADDALGKLVEPGASLVSARFAAMHSLAQNGILTGVTMMPILPFLEDNEQNVTRIVQLAAENGASYILAAFGLTMRDRQRAYFYGKLDQLFPGVRAKYERRYGERYECSAPEAARLENLFRKLCANYGVATKMRHYHPPEASQPGLF